MAVAVKQNIKHTKLLLFFSFTLFILGFANSNGLSRRRRISIRRRTSKIRRTTRRRRRRSNLIRRRRNHSSWRVVSIFLVIIVCYLNSFKVGSS